jgi:hypothetical protein
MKWELNEKLYMNRRAMYFKNRCLHFVNFIAMPVQVVGSGLCMIVLVLVDGLSPAIRNGNF